MPEYGQYNSPDKIGSVSCDRIPMTNPSGDAGNPLTYTYVFNNPLLFIDPLGLCADADYPCQLDRCLDKGYLVYNGMNPNCVEFGQNCPPKLVTSCQTLGLAICKEWAYTNDVRRIDTIDLTKWGNMLKAGKKSCCKDRQALLIKINNERIIYMKSGPAIKRHPKKD